MTAQNAQRELQLETLRGLAAVSVLVWHCLLAFLPEYVGVYGQLPSSFALVGMPFFGLVFGTFAVAFFFTLSGYVLSRHFFASGDTGHLLRNAIKRWPRLALPVAASTIVSWALFRLDLYAFDAAGAATGSPWLKSFGGAPGLGKLEPNFVGAAWQGVYGSFFQGDTSYNSSLWSMSVELIGSYITLCMALLVVTFRQVRVHVFFAIMFVLIAQGVGKYWYVCFLAGVGLARYLPVGGVKLPAITAWLLVLAAVFLGGYSDLHKGVYNFIYSWCFNLEPVFVWTLASVMLIVAVSSGDAVSSAFSKPWGRFLGRISFPLYLIHVPIICSCGAGIFLLVDGIMAWRLAAVAVTIVITMVCATMAAVPLAYVNDWWISRVNRATEMFIGR
jgi:peptidoglycan/LPS O-acetylase OafA/YrhL